MSASQTVSRPRNGTVRTEPVDMEAFLAKITRERRMREAPPANYACVIFKRRQEKERLELQKLDFQETIARIRRSSPKAKIAGSPLKNGESISGDVEETRAPETAQPAVDAKMEFSPLKNEEAISCTSEQDKAPETGKPEINAKTDSSSKILFGAHKGIDVKLLIGPSRQEFHVEQWELVYHSELFHDLLHKEGNSRFEPLVIEEVDPDVFQLFTTWISTCKLPQPKAGLSLVRGRQEDGTLELVWDYLMTRAYIFATSFGIRLLAKDIYNTYALMLSRSRDTRDTRRNFDALPTSATYVRLFGNAPLHSMLCELFAMEYMERWSRSKEQASASFVGFLSETLLAKVAECHRKVQEKKEANGGVLPGTIVLPPRTTRRLKGVKAEKVVASMGIKDPEQPRSQRTFLQRISSFLPF